MAVPDFQVFLLPFLKAVSDGQIHRMRDLTQQVADTIGLTAEDREEKIPTGQFKYANRIGWARTSLKKAGLVTQPERGQVVITNAGRELLGENLPKIDRQILLRYPGFVEYSTPSERVAETEEQPETPQELLIDSFNQLKAATKDELITRLKLCSPRFFEDTVLTVLRAMGYGMIGGEAKVTGQSGDGGIDGIISEDKLGLDKICFQAKRWENNVGGPTIQQFIGSMNGANVRKGVVITTAEFTPAARQAAERTGGMTIVLVDGDMLAELMIAYKVGVVVKQTYEVTEISEDFFED